MKNKSHVALAGALWVLSVMAALAAGVALPGDRGPMGSLPMPGAMPPSGPPPVRPPPNPAYGPSIALALKAAQAVAEACKQFPYGLAIVDSDGVAKLVYVPDGAEAWHGYSAIRKAYTAVMFKSDTSKVLQRAHEDPSVAEKFKSDPNLQPQAGGVVLMVGDKLVGAIGVSGAEPGGHDEECGVVGRDKIKNELK